MRKKERFSITHGIMRAVKTISEWTASDVLKKTLFQLHWFFGITAGLVLALMGITGAASVSYTHLTLPTICSV